MDRRRVVDEAIHSNEMAGAYVSVRFRKDAEEYVQGNIDIDEFMLRTNRRWAKKAKEKTHA